MKKAYDPFSSLFLPDPFSSPMVVRPMYAPKGAIASRFRNFSKSLTMRLNKITNASHTIQWIATLITAVIVCLNAGCQKQGGSARAAEATKVLQSLKLISSRLAEYASVHNKFPDSLDVLQYDSTIKSIPLHYRGATISLTRTKDYIVVYADPEYFRVVGIPVIWSDGTVETLAATYLSSELEKQNRILGNHRGQKLEGFRNE